MQMNIFFFPIFPSLSLSLFSLSSCFYFPSYFINHPFSQRLFLCLKSFFLSFFCTSQPLSFSVWFILFTLISFSIFLPLYHIFELSLFVSSSLPSSPYLYLLYFYIHTVSFSLFLSVSLSLYPFFSLYRSLLYLISFSHFFSSYLSPSRYFLSTFSHTLFL